MLMSPHMCTRGANLIDVKLLNKLNTTFCWLTFLADSYNIVSETNYIGYKIISGTNRLWD